MSDLIAIQSEFVAQHEVFRNLNHKMRKAFSYWGEPDQFYEEIPIESRKAHIGFIGRFYSEKGIDQLARAIPLVVKQIPEVQFILIGKGPLENQVKKILCVEAAEDHVDFLGQIKNNQLVKLYNQFKLLVIPSISEGLPNVLLEAFACGTPVLASAVGAIPDIIDDGVNGFLLESAEPAIIAQRINEILSKPENLPPVTKNAQELLHTRFSKQASASQFKEMFIEVISK